MKAEELIRYFKSLGLTVHTGTKARGHQGFFLNNRIDISKISLKIDLFQLFYMNLHTIYIQNLNRI